jgi:hypothetical protein
MLEDQAPSALLILLARWWRFGMRVCRAILLQISKSTWLKVIGALTLLGVYISVVLLSFTNREKSLINPSTGLPGSQPMFDRTYVTHMHREDQLPSLITLAHSLLQQQSQYGLLVLLPTGRPAAAKHHRPPKGAKKLKPKSSTSNQYHHRSRTEDEQEAEDREDARHRWSAETLAILRAIPNLTVQELSHIQFPPVETPEEMRIAAKRAASGAADAPVVSFASAVQSLLMFEIWRLTSYKQVLYLDIATVVHGNLDYLLKSDFERDVAGVGATQIEGTAKAAEKKKATAETASTASPSSTSSSTTGSTETFSAPEVDAAHLRRAPIIDIATERWLHFHSRKEHILTPDTPASHATTAHLEPVDWFKSHAATTPPYLQIAAPMQLTRHDCAVHPEIVQLGTRDPSSSSAPDGGPSSLLASSAGSAPLFQTSLEWSLFAGGMVLLVPNAFTYHQLLAFYTHTHVERKTRFSTAFSQRLRRQKFSDHPSRVLNNFFAEPCAHGLEDHHDHHHGSAVTLDGTTQPALATGMAEDTKQSGCWHPLPFNFSLVSHTCACEQTREWSESGAGMDARIGLASVGLQGNFGMISPPSSSSTRPSSPDDADASCGVDMWSDVFLPSSTVEILRRCEQLTIVEKGEGEEEGETSEKPKEATSKHKSKSSHATLQTSTITPASPSSSSSSSSSSSLPSPSYYSQLLSVLSWRSAEEQEQARHRYAWMYLDETRKETVARVDAWVGEQQANKTAAALVEGGNQAECCGSRFKRIFQLYFEALKFTRPKFDGRSKRAG